MRQDLEARVNLLYDIEAIKELKALFCYLADARIAGDSSKSNELLSLFTDDIRLEFAHRDTFEGKEALVKTFWQADTSSAWRQEFLDAWNIDYVYEGIYEKMLGEGSVPTPGVVVYQNDTVTIYQIDR